MKQKLTKNDSMCTVEKDFDVLADTFEAFLKGVGAHGFFFKNWAENHDYNDTAYVFYAWREQAKIRHSSLWINSAFIWMETGQGLYYWHTIHSMWKRHLKDNLNK